MLGDDVWVMLMKHDCSKGAFVAHVGELNVKREVNDNFFYISNSTAYKMTGEAKLHVDVAFHPIKERFYHNLKHALKGILSYENLDKVCGQFKVIRPGKSHYNMMVDKNWSYAWGAKKGYDSLRAHVEGSQFTIPLHADALDATTSDFVEKVTDYMHNQGIECGYKECDAIRLTDYISLRVDHAGGEYIPTDLSLTTSASPMTQQRTHALVSLLRPDCMERKANAGQFSIYNHAIPYRRAIANYKSGVLGESEGFRRVAMIKEMDRQELKQRQDIAAKVRMEKARLHMRELKEGHDALVNDMSRLMQKEEAFNLDIKLLGRVRVHLKSYMNGGVFKLRPHSTSMQTLCSIDGCNELYKKLKIEDECLRSEYGVPYVYNQHRWWTIVRECITMLQEDLVKAGLV